MPRMATTPVATLADLRGVTPWLWVICERCLHRAPTALAPWIIRWALRPRAICSVAQRGADNAAARARRSKYRDGVGCRGQCADGGGRHLGSCEVLPPNHPLLIRWPALRLVGLD